MKKAMLMVAIAGIAASGVLAAPMITSVGVLNPNNAYSVVNALTTDTDGTVYAVGASRLTLGYEGTNLNQTQPFLWTAASGIQYLPHGSGSADNHDARGVSIIYKSSIVGDTLPKIGISGSVGAIARWYVADLATPTVPNNGTGFAGSDLASNMVIGSYNTSRTDQDRTDGRTQMVGRNTSTNAGYRYRFYPSAGNAGYVGTGQTDLASISNNGSVVGTDRGGSGGARRAVYALTANSTPLAIPGLGSIRSEGYGISEDAQWMSGLDYFVSGQNQGFKWKQGDASATLLPRYVNPDSTLDTIACAYAINDDGIAVGNTYLATRTPTYLASVWDSTGLWGTNNECLYVKDVLDAAGVDTSAWRYLTRVTTISDDGMTIGGYGVWNADGSTRGFIASIPEPATAILLALGSLLVIRRRR